MLLYHINKKNQDIAVIYWIYVPYRFRFHCIGLGGEQSSVGYYV